MTEHPENMKIHFAFVDYSLERKYVVTKQKIWKMT